VAEIELAPLREKLETVKTGFFRSWSKLVTDSRAKGREYLNSWEATKKQWDAQASAAPATGATDGNETTNDDAAMKQTATATHQDGEEAHQTSPPPLARTSPQEPENVADDI
jgi:hypothetical protein